MEKRTDKLNNGELWEQQPWGRKDTYGLAISIVVILTWLVIVTITLWKWLAIISIALTLIGAVSLLLHMIVLPASTHWHTVRLHHKREQDKHDLYLEDRRAKLAAFRSPYIGGTVDADTVSEDSTPAPGTPEREIDDFLRSASERTMPALPRKSSNGATHDLSDFDLDDGSSLDIGSETSRQIAEYYQDGLDVSAISRRVFGVRGGQELTEANVQVKAVLKELVANGLE